MEEAGWGWRTAAFHPVGYHSQVQRREVAFLTGVVDRDDVAATGTSPQHYFRQEATNQDHAGPAVDTADQ